MFSSTVAPSSKLAPPTPSELRQMRAAAQPTPNAINTVGGISAALIREGCLVPDDARAGGASKQQQSVVTVSLVRQPRARIARGSLGEQKINLYYQLSLTTIAGAAFTGTFAVSPSLSSEYADVANLYDEIIVDSGRMQFLHRNDLDTPYTTDTGVEAWVWAYDPLDSNSLSSTLNGMQHSQHFLFAPPTSGPGGFQGAPLAVNGSGLFSWSFHVPRSSARRTADAKVFGHDWSDTADTTAAYGYHKPYFASLGASGTVHMQCYITLHCRVRSRS